MKKVYSQQQEKEEKSKLQDTNGSLSHSVDSLGTKKDSLAHPKLPPRTVPKTPSNKQPPLPPVPTSKKPPVPSTPAPKLPQPPSGLSASATVPTLPSRDTKKSLESVIDSSRPPLPSRPPPPNKHVRSVSSGDADTLDYTSSEPIPPPQPKEDPPPLPKPPLPSRPAPKKEVDAPKPQKKEVDAPKRLPTPKEHVNKQKPPHKKPLPDVGGKKMSMEISNPPPLPKKQVKSVGSSEGKRIVTELNSSAPHTRIVQHNKINLATPSVPPPKLISNTSVVEQN